MLPLSSLGLLCVLVGTVLSVGCRSEGPVVTGPQKTEPVATPSVPASAPEFKEAWLTGTILDEHGAPATGMRVQVTPVPKEEWLRAFYLLKSMTVPAHEPLESESPGEPIDASGQFRAELSEPRVHNVRVLQRWDGRDHGYFDSGWVRWEGEVDCRGNGEIVLPTVTLAPRAVKDAPRF